MMDECVCWGMSVFVWEMSVCWGLGGFLVDEKSLVFSVNSGFCYYTEKNLSGSVNGEG